MKRLVLLLAATLWAGCAFAQSLSFPGPGSAATAGGGGGPMVTPILFAGPQGVGPSATVVNYLGLLGGNLVNGWSGTAVIRQIPFPAAGTISGLSVRYPAGAGAAGTYQVSLVKNGTLSTNVTCLIPNSGTTCTAAGSETVAPGDLLEWQSCPGSVPAGTCVTGGTQTANAQVQISAVFTSTNPNESFILGPGSTGGATNTAANYGAFGGYVSYVATETVNSNVIPTSGAIDKFYVYGGSQVAPGASKWWFFTLFKNGAATTLQCSTTGTVVGAGGISCNDTTHSVSVAAGDTISVEMCPQASGTYSGSCTVGGTPSVSVFAYSSRWIPTIPGEAVALVVASPGQPTGVTTALGNIVGAIGGASVANEAFVYNLSTGFTIKKLVTQVLPAPGGTANRTLSLRANGATAGSIGCAITSAITGCSDTTNTYTAAAGALLDWQQTVANSPVAATQFKISAVVTVP